MNYTIPSLLARHERERGATGYELTVDRLVQWTSLSKHRIARIFSGEICPTEKEWMEISNFVGGFFRTIPYARIHEAYVSSDEKNSTPNTLIADDSGTGKVRNTHLLHQSPIPILS